MCRTANRCLSASPVSKACMCHQHMPKQHTNLHIQVDHAIGLAPTCANKLRCDCSPALLTAYARIRECAPVAHVALANMVAGRNVVAHTEEAHTVVGHIVDQHRSSPHCSRPPRSEPPVARSIVAHIVVATISEPPSAGGGPKCMGRHGELQASRHTGVLEPMRPRLVHDRRRPANSRCG